MEKEVDGGGTLEEAPSFSLATVTAHGVACLKLNFVFMISRGICCFSLLVT
jgi:hypothetical protein